jgi:hypothetical protein
VAEAGEVQVSETVVHLAHKLSGLCYLDRGAVPLKGFPELVHVFQLRPDSGEVPAATRVPAGFLENIGRVTQLPIVSQAETVLAQLLTLHAILAQHGDHDDRGACASQLVAESGVEAVGTVRFVYASLAVCLLEMSRELEALPWAHTSKDSGCYLATDPIQDPLPLSNMRQGILDGGLHAGYTR